VAQGTQFTCFTGTNIRAVLVQNTDADAWLTGPRSKPDGTKVQILILYWYKSTNTDADAWLKGPRSKPDSTKVQIRMLYWYKSTNTDADAWLKGPRSKPAKPDKNQDASPLLGAHFTCFTGTKLQILLLSQRSTKMRLLY
jgi:hypothetical protein